LFEALDLRGYVPIRQVVFSNFSELATLTIKTLQPKSTALHQ
jgi:hypothetical protein